LTLFKIATHNITLYSKIAIDLPESLRRSEPTKTRTIDQCSPLPPQLTSDRSILQPKVICSGQLRVVVVVHQRASKISFDLRKLLISSGRYTFRFQTQEQPLQRHVPSVNATTHALRHPIMPEHPMELAVDALAWAMA